MRISCSVSVLSFVFVSVSIRFKWCSLEFPNCIIITSETLKDCYGYNNNVNYLWTNSDLKCGMKCKCMRWRTPQKDYRTHSGFSTELLAFLNEIFLKDDLISLRAIRFLLEMGYWVLSIEFCPWWLVWDVMNSFRCWSCTLHILISEFRHYFSLKKKKNRMTYRKQKEQNQSLLFMTKNQQIKSPVLKPLSKAELYNTSILKPLHR